MKYTTEEVKVLLASYVYPACKATGFEFKSESGDDYKDVRVDDYNIRVTDTSFYVPLDIRKTMYYAYRFEVEIRRVNAQNALVLDFIDNRIENDRKATSKIVEFSVNYRKQYEKIANMTDAELLDFVAKSIAA